MNRPFEPAQVAKVPPCAAGCPNNTDVRGWVSTIAQRKKLGLEVDEAYRSAWETIVDVNPFPAVMGRICPHPCEAGCNRHGHDDGIAVHELERFLGDWALEQRLPLRRRQADPHELSVGVIGSGPAGLSFAYQMIRRGHAVTVYESYPKPGGMLRYGVPPYRLPREVLDGEIQRILDLGVDLRVNARVGRDVDVAELDARHDVVLVGIGAHSGKRLGIPGEPGPDIWTGTRYLSRRSLGEDVDLGQRVIVIGGGDTAIDAARVARREGADVTVLYRRTRSEMPAIATEIDEALEEGIHIEYLVAPVQIGRSDGRVTSIRVRRMKLGLPDESGRRRPVPVNGSDFEIGVDSVIAAVSQEPDWSGLDSLRDDAADTPSAGDVLGLGIASRAVAQARFAAESVRARLAGAEMPTRTARESVFAPQVKLDYYAQGARVIPGQRPPADRLRCPEDEIHTGITQEQFEAEVARCLSCGQCFGCEACWTYCVHGCFEALEEPRPGTYFSLSLERCEACGKCVDVCPCGYLQPRVNGGDA